MQRVEIILDKIKILQNTQGGKAETPLLVAIDGRCASGKTTLATELQQKTAQKCNIIHADHFFPRPEQRTAERMAEPGGNIDYERLLADVLLPLKKGEPFSYRPFDCRTQSLAEEIHTEPAALNIIEGSYSCHPELYDYYDLRIFLSIDPAEQMHRVILRNGETEAEVFRDKWIPMEERYFAAFDIPNRCELRYE